MIQKSDKENTVVILNKDVYIKHIESLLSDKAKFEKANTKKVLLNFFVNRDKRIIEYLKSLKSSGALSVEQHKKSKVVGSKPGLHKNMVNRCPPFRSILSAIGTPSYKIEKF